MANITEKLSKQVLMLPESKISILLLNQDSLIRYPKNFIFSLKKTGNGNGEYIGPEEIYNGEEILSLDYIDTGKGELKTYLLGSLDISPEGVGIITKLTNSGQYFFNKSIIQNTSIPEDSDQLIAYIKKKDNYRNSKPLAVIDGHVKRNSKINKVDFEDGFKIVDGKIQPNYTSGFTQITIKASIELLGLVIDIEKLSQWMNENKIVKMLINGTTINKGDSEDSFIFINGSSFDVQYFTTTDLISDFDLSYISFHFKDALSANNERTDVIISSLLERIAVSTNSTLYCVDKKANRYFRSGIIDTELLSPDFRIKTILSRQCSLLNATLSDIYTSLFKSKSSNAFIGNVADKLSQDSSKFIKNNISDILFSNFSMGYNGIESKAFELNYLLPDISEPLSDPTYRFSDVSILNTNNNRPSVRSSSSLNGGRFSYVTLDGLRLGIIHGDTSDPNYNNDSINRGILSPVMYDSGVFTLWLADVLPAETQFENNDVMTHCKGVFAMIPEVIRDSISIDMVRTLDGVDETERITDFEIIGNVIKISRALSYGGTVSSFRVNGLCYSIVKTAVIGRLFEAVTQSRSEEMRDREQYISGQNHFRLPIDTGSSQKFVFSIFTTGLWLQPARTSYRSEKDFVKSVFFNASVTPNTWESVRLQTLEHDVIRLYELYNSYPHVKITLTVDGSEINYYLILFLDIDLSKSKETEVLTWDNSSGKIYDKDLEEYDKSSFIEKFNLISVKLEPKSNELIVNTNGKSEDTENIDIAVGGYLVPWNNRTNEHRYNIPYNEYKNNDDDVIYRRRLDSNIFSGHNLGRYLINSLYDLEDKRVIPNKNNITTVNNLNYQYKKIIDLTHCNDHVYVDIEVTYKKAVQEFLVLAKAVSRFIFAMKEQRFTGSFKETFFYSNMHMRKYKKAELHIGFPLLFLNSTQVKNKQLSDFVDVKITIRQKPRRRQIF